MTFVYRSPVTFSRQRAFTILEMLVVVAIVGSLLAIALPGYREYMERAKNTTAASEISAISSKLMTYFQDNRQFPASLSVLYNPVPNDPWGNPYEYLAIDIDPPPSKGKVRKDKKLNPLNSDFDLYSMGADGETVTPLTGKSARDDIVRADNGGFIGLATNH